MLCMNQNEMQVIAIYYTLQKNSSLECCGHITHYLGNLNTTINNFLHYVKWDLMDMYGHLRALIKKWYIKLDFIGK
jgi:hypothetical protein